VSYGKNNDRDKLRRKNLQQVFLSALFPLAANKVHVISEIASDAKIY